MCGKRPFIKRLMHAFAGYSNNFRSLPVENHLAIQRHRFFPTRRQSKQPPHPIKKRTIRPSQKQHHQRSTERTAHQSTARRTAKSNDRRIDRHLKTHQRDTVPQQLRNPARSRTLHHPIAPQAVRARNWHHQNGTN